MTNPPCPTSDVPGLVFSEEEHRYWIDGEELPSVTQILEAEGIYYNPRATDYHRQRGSLVHKGCDLVEGGRWNSEATSEELRRYISGYPEFLRASGFQPLLREQAVCSRVHRFAGTLDRYGLLPGHGHGILDIKTGRPESSHYIQMALYGIALQEFHDLDIEFRAVLWLPGNGDYVLDKPRTGQSYRRDKSIGISAVTLYHYRRTEGKLRKETAL